MWQSPRGKRAMTHWASLLRWIWPISECNLMTRDSRSRPPKGGPIIRECRGSGPEKQKPKHNPCWPRGRNWRKPIVLTIWPRHPGHFRELGKNQAPAYSVSDKGSCDRLKPKHAKCVSTQSMIFVRWHSPSQALTAKHVLYPQLTATSNIYLSRGSQLLVPFIWK